ncbi:MAG: hypothetical protein ACOX4U_01565 [Anaerovoracaceae bacterium]|jgi:hypothetical protein
MEPLITIESVPISIEYVEKTGSSTARRSSNSTNLRISHQNNQRTIKSGKIHIPMDSFTYSPPSKAKNLSYTATAGYSKDGRLSMNVHFSHDEGSGIKYSNISRGIDNLVDMVSKATSQGEWAPENLSIHFDMSMLPGELANLDKQDISFMPPDLELKVVERPKVIIKYVGGPIYIPRSADPDYEPPDENFIIGDGKPILDAKA